MGQKLPQIKKMFHVTLKILGYGHLGVGVTIPSPYTSNPFVPPRYNHKKKSDIYLTDMTVKNIFLTCQQLNEMTEMLTRE